MATYTSKATGNWNDLDSWSDGVGVYKAFDSVNASSWWFVEANAIDGDLDTYCTGSGGDVSEYFILTLTSAITNCTKIRVLINAFPIDGDVDADLEIWTSTNGVDWVKVHDTTVPNGTTHGWYEIAFDSQALKAIRFKRKDADIAVYIFEAEAFDASGSGDYPKSGDDATIQNGHTITLNGAAECEALTISAGGVLTCGDDHNLTVNDITSISGHLQGQGGTITHNHNVTINEGGTYDLTTDITYFKEDVTNNGTFNHNNGSIIMNGTDQCLISSSQMSFYNFTKSVTVAQKLEFTAGHRYVFEGNITLNGIVGELLTIKSLNTGQSFSFAMVEGAVKTKLEYLSVKDSNASPSHASHTPINPTNSVDVSGNTDWFEEEEEEIITTFLLARCYYY